jgi:hypothetical protein
LAESGINLAIAQEHVACGRGRGHFTTIEGDQSPVGQAQRHEASATETRIVAIDDPEGEGAGDGRIDRIAAIPQGLQARLGGHRIHGRNQTLARCGRFGCGDRLVQSENRQKANQHRHKSHSEQRLTAGAEMDATSRLGVVFHEIAGPIIDSSPSPNPDQLPG